MGKHKNKNTRSGRTSVKNKAYKKARLLCNREKDLDQIQVRARHIRNSIVCSSLWLLPYLWAASHKCRMK